MSKTKHTRTISWFKEHGIHGKDHPEDLDAEIIQDWGEEGGDTTWIVFADGGKFWRLTLKHHPEDYQTNDLVEFGPNHKLEVVEVELKKVETWVEVDPLVNPS